MKTVYWDIETTGSDKRDLFKPEFKAPSNYKNPELIKESIAEQEKQWNEQAALSPLTGSVLCIGVRIDYTRSLERVEQKTVTVFLCVDGVKSSGSYNGSIYSCFIDEKSLLEYFWQLWIEHSGDSKMVGFAVLHFDLPFLIRRSYALGVKVPHSVLGLKKYQHDPVIDLQENWGLWTQDRISLNNFAKFLGVGEKNGNGKDFAELYKTDRQKALEYLSNDLTLVQKIYERLYL